jgi:hypothetical protein
MLAAIFCRWAPPLRRPEPGSVEQAFIHEGLQPLEHFGPLQLLQGHPGLIPHGGILVQEQAVHQGFHHLLLAGLHQIGIKAPQRPGAVAAHRGFAVDAQGLQQLGGGGIGLGGGGGAGIGQGAGRPEPPRLQATALRT